MLEVAATDAEYLMFADAASDEPASPWAVPWLTTPSDGGRGAAAPGAAARIAAGPPGAGMASVLDALDEAATAFAALPGDTALVDAEDFDRGIRQLRRIVLAAGIRGEVAGTAIEPAGT